MLPPHWVVRDAARIARALADQARRSGEPDHAAYFEQVAAEADGRADYLMLLRTKLARPIRAAPGPRGRSPRSPDHRGGFRPCRGFQRRNGTR